MENLFRGNREAKRAIHLINHTNKTVFLTGKAGTGKSTLLRYLISYLINKKHVLLAPTGIAALNVGGQTIHSFFEFSIRPYLCHDRDLPDLSHKKELLEKLDLIIIDEISMVRADIMNAIDLTLRKTLQNDAPFGGKQMLLVGDLLQLPPVVNSRYQEEVEIIREGYQTVYFFSAPVFNSINIELVELQKVYRQENIDFVKTLNNVRGGWVTNQDLEKVNERYVPGFVSPEGDDIITLTTTNQKANVINQVRLDATNKPEFSFEAKKEGSFDLDNPPALPTDSTLVLKEGAQIIFIKNDVERRWVNGTIGKITEITQDCIRVKANGKTLNVEKMEWEDISYRWNQENDVIEKGVVGKFTQYPIRLAWAITIHKSQGQTFDKVIINLDKGSFATGQAYVALSRCTSLEGIILHTRINRQDIKAEQVAIQYLQAQGKCSMRRVVEMEIAYQEIVAKLEKELGLQSKMPVEKTIQNDALLPT